MTLDTFASITFFGYPPDIRKAIYTTNTIHRVAEQCDSPGDKET